MARFGAVLTAMVTPFDSEGALDIAAAEKLANYLIDNGNDGVVLAGTTGESPTISVAEQVELVSAVRQAIPDSVVIAGAGSNDTASAITNIEKLQSHADGLLLVTPYYNRPSQAGLQAHFEALSAVAEKPIMLYDIPGRTGRKIATETLLALAQLENVVALKDAAGDLAETASFVDQVDESFEVYSGDDALNLPFLSIGAVGCVSVAAHWAGTEISNMIAAFTAGDVQKARQLNAQLLSSYEFESGDDTPNPIPAKVMMNLLGLSVGECRLPMGPPPQGLGEKVKSVLADLGRM